MSVDIRALSGGRPVVWSWCGTCRRGGSNKWYAGVVIANADGTYDGICAGAAIGSSPRLYPQISGVSSQTHAISIVQAQCNKKKKEYSDDPGFLVGLNLATAANIRSQPAAPASDLRVIWPMLAPNSTPESKITDMMKDGSEWIAEEKFDGMRLIGQMDITGTRYTSRGASVNDPARPIEKTDALPHLNIAFPASLWGTAIDGELIAEGKISSDVSGTLRAKDGRSTDDLVMVLYDLPYYQGQDLTDSAVEMPFWRRRELLELVFESMTKFWIHENGSLVGFPFRLVLQHRSDKEDLLKQVLADGGEGIMLKKKDGLYVQGKRPSETMYKIKKHMEDDVIIIGYTDGKGKYAGQIGAIRFGQYVPKAICALADLRPIKAEQTHQNLQRVIPDTVDPLGLCELGQTSGMSDAIRRELTDNGDTYVGRVMKVKAMERLPGGTFRHPQFVEIREPGDKAAAECIWEG
jgi:ATP-dependent DNA ligase